VLEGPLEAAKRLQRLADICSGAYVLPIEHWQKLDVPKPAPVEPPSSKPLWLKVIFGVLDEPVAMWLAGLLTGYFIGGR
jgi:hypothetical protein